MFEGKWKDDEVVDLFKNVEDAKEHGKTIKDAFLVHAQKYERRPNSVRNYYYREVDDLINNESRLKKLGIDISKHKKQEVKFFSEKEGEKIIAAINKLVYEGNSVRQACLKLSGGNIALMLRYQNKYRNSQLKKQEVKQENKVNILDYKNKQKKLTEEDITSLFMGLVKLIKKMAFDEVAQTLKKERDSAGFLLKKALIDLNKKEREYESLKESFKEIEDKNKMLLEKVTALKLLNAKKLTEKLKSFKEGRASVN